MKIKYNNLIVIPMYGGNSCMNCCFFYNLGTLCIRDKFPDLGPCISKSKYYKRISESDIFEL